MTHTVANTTKEVAVSTGYFNMATINIIDRDGDWFIYQPANANNSALGSSIKPYKWATALPIAGGFSNLQIDGTLPLIVEPWDGANVQYHGGTIEHIGEGINDITATVESDAYFFPHLGSLSTDPDDQAFYWDRAYIPSGSSDLYFYQYHKHLPTTYPGYENGRITTSAGNFINPDDKSFGYLIHTKVRVSATFYQSVLARIHTPSVGGAHNSHNDVTLPTVANKNYIMGGIIKGSGSRFHAFYLTAEGSQWRLYSRTYIAASTSFTAQVDHGVYDFADPTLNVVDLTGSCHNYPVRVSCGDLSGTKIYFPVILNNAVSGFDLEIWSFSSADSLTVANLTRNVLLSGVSVRPDCQLCTVGDNIYAVATNVAGGGINLFVFNGTVWEGAVAPAITNGSAQQLRIHGFRYNPQDVTFYTLVSGTSTNTGNYTGPGLYSFKLSAAFAGYTHLDYDHTTNSFIKKEPLANGHLIYTKATGSISRSGDQEPEGIATSVNILTYEPTKPTFFNKSTIDLGGDEYIYQGIRLFDSRKFMAGRIENLPYGKGVGDLLISLVEQDENIQHHIAFGGIEGSAVDPSVDVSGDDYITGVYQSRINHDKVWICGYSKSEMVPKKDIKIHGYCRNMSDSPSALDCSDVITDSDGNIYLVGTNQNGYCNITKYDANYLIKWQYQIGSENNVVGSSIAIDSSNNIYVVGTVENDIMIAKISSAGSLIWSKTFGTASLYTGTGIAVVTKTGTQYVVVAGTYGTSTTFLVLNTSGNIVEQNNVSNLVVNRVRNHKSSTDGRFVFAGTDGSTNGKFGVGSVLDPTRMILWSSTFGTAARDIGNIDSGSTPGYIVCGSTGSAGMLLKITATENSGSYTINKIWARSLASASFNAVAVSAHTEATRYIYVVGMTPTGGTAAMGMDEGLICKYDNNGTQIWENVFGHDMNESITGVCFDTTGDNIIVSGWSESHSTSRDAIVFRCSTNGFGTGVYHLAGNAGIPYYYLKTTLVDSSDATSVGGVSSPSNSIGTLSLSNITLAYDEAGALIRNFDGSYGRNGVFTLFFGYVELSKIQEYKNSEAHRLNQEAGRLVDYVSDVFTLWQVATVGDGSADDGNVFGYDIIEATDGTIYVICQTSADLAKTNTGASGVYDYALVKFDQTTEEMEIYQNGTDLDEEVYALTELENGKIAFCGRTTSNIGGISEGGYDIFLGIYNPTNDTFEYFNKGSGLDDRAINLHDIGGGFLGIVYSTFGNLGGTNIGPQDIGFIGFNYTTNTWGVSYLVGTTSTDLFEQNGKPSTKLKDGRVAVVFSTGGVFDPEDTNYGYLDIAIAIGDPATGKYVRGQVGSQQSEIATSISSDGERVLITGYQSESFGRGAQGIYVEADIEQNVIGRSTSVVLSA